MTTTPSLDELLDESLGSGVIHQMLLEVRECLETLVPAIDAAYRAEATTRQFQYTAMTIGRGDDETVASIAEITGTDALDAIVGHLCAGVQQRRGTEPVAPLDWAAVRTLAAETLDRLNSEIETYYA